GHHGANHPVLELRSGRVSVTSQNHSFQVEAASIPPGSGFCVSHINLSDGSVEGLASDDLPAFSVQYHPEAAPGPEAERTPSARFAAVGEPERPSPSASPPRGAGGPGRERREIAGLAMVG